ncbi:MAG TPA: hypothetical protein DCR40_18105 [Prolixibacteraceae bacterium]|nr:hypothetical protein [Prolixibacteraceae bacterium]
MKDVFLKTVTRLKTVSALKWIDAEDGQLDFFEGRPPVAFPCALIDVEYPNCEDESDTIQMVTARVTVRLAFEPVGQTNGAAPTLVQTKALSRYDTVNACYTALQGWGDGEVSGFSRKSQTTEKRDDNLKVIVQVWETSFEEDSLP